MACREKIAKLVPSPSQVAPRGVGVPIGRKLLLFDGLGEPVHAQSHQGDGKESQDEPFLPKMADPDSFQEHPAQDLEKVGEGSALPV